MTTYAPAYELDGPVNKVCTAYMIEPYVQAVFAQQFLPTAVTEMTRWLLDRAGYVPSWPSSRVFWPRCDPSRPS